ncbi:hypothetical protein QTG56_22740 (plasmid) [Rossellomorea sp. AcN35-11]|nr:hypothetical protein [Rossellomorea aquimaris]WJV32188.1 hypothetical protein QTG56_22740 [Rossellomorea sp. AcN35-11]
MSKALGQWMTLFIVINFLFAPILAYKVSLEKEAIEVVLNEGAKKAAIEGRFTTAIIDEMEQTLVNNYNFDPTKINITATTALTYRQDYLTASIEVPKSIIFILDIFNQGPTTIKKDIKIMSEYVG